MSIDEEGFALQEAEKAAYQAAQQAADQLVSTVASSSTSTQVAPSAQVAAPASTQNGAAVATTTVVSAVEDTAMEVDGPSERSKGKRKAEDDIGPETGEAKKVKTGKFL